MNNDWPEERDQYGRLDTDLSKKDPADRDDDARNDIERRDSLTSILKSVTPAKQPDPAVYGDTDLNPNEDDQRDVHDGDADERV